MWRICYHQDPLNDTQVELSDSTPLDVVSFLHLVPVPAIPEGHLHSEVKCWLHHSCNAPMSLSEVGGNNTDFY